MAKIDCPECGHPKADSIDSRPSNSEENWWIRRRRFQCASCSHRFTTYEFLAQDLEGFRTDTTSRQMERIQSLAQQITDITEAN